MEQFAIKSHDKLSLSCRLWADVETPKGVLQITHGMAEYIMRYDRFAKFMNENGYIVFGNDLRAHGETAGNPNRVGKVLEGDLFTDTLNDQIFLTKYLEKKYPNLPIFLMGHSYGSFLTQKYIQECHIPKAVILMGTAHQKNILTAFGKQVAKITCKCKGQDAPAKLIAKLSFDSYAKQFKEGAWITRDHEIAKSYYADEYCNVVFSAGFYKSFFTNLRKLYTKENLSKIPKDLPLFLIAGEADPVGGKGKMVKKLHKCYQENGLTNTSITLYQDMRHEILNEIDYQEPQNDILAFINQNNK